MSLCSKGRRNVGNQIHCGALAEHMMQHLDSCTGGGHWNPCKGTTFVGDLSLPASEAIGGFSNCRPRKESIDPRNGP